MHVTSNSQAAGRVALECSRSPGGFPMRQVPVGAFEELRVPMRIAICDGVQLLVERVKQRMGSQLDTGYALWPAAVILARYLARRK